MRYGHELRFMFAIAGAERSGKTFFSEHFARAYQRSKGPVIVYNPGREDDFKEYQYLEFVPTYKSVEIMGLDPKTDKRKIRRILRSTHFTHFKIGGKVYQCKDLNAVLHKVKAVKVTRLSHPLEEGRFFKTVHDFVSGALLIGDDFRPVARNIGDYRLSPMLELFSRKNHCGKKAGWRPTNKDRMGVDVICIFHHPDKVNTEIYDFVSHIFLFKVTRQIKGRTVDNDDALEALTKAYSALQSAPRYSYARIDLKGENPAGFKVISPRQNQSK